MSSVLAQGDSDKPTLDKITITSKCKLKGLQADGCKRDAHSNKETRAEDMNI